MKEIRDDLDMTRFVLQTWTLMATVPLTDAQIAFWNFNTEEGKTKCVERMCSLCGVGHTALAAWQPRDNDKASAEAIAKKLTTTLHEIEKDPSGYRVKPSAWKK